MAIVIHSVLGPTPRGVLAVVEHGDQRLEAEVAARAEEIEPHVGWPIPVEMDFHAVEAARAVRPDQPDDHGLFPAPSGAVRIVGSVRQIVEVGDGGSIVEVYLRRGPEHVAFESTSLPFAPAVGDGIEVTVSGLCFFPTWV